jgi:hypothetical protein
MGAGTFDGGGVGVFMDASILARFALCGHEFSGLFLDWFLIANKDRQTTLRSRPTQHIPCDTRHSLVLQAPGHLSGCMLPGTTAHVPMRWPAFTQTGQS